MSAPEGRLSLVAGCAVPVSDVVAATMLYYVPAVGNAVPVWDGWHYDSQDIGDGLSLALSATYQTFYGPYDVFAFMDGMTLRIGHGPNWLTGGGTQFARGTGAGSTELETKCGLLTNKNPITLRWGSAAGNADTVAANQATYLGTFVCNVAGTITSSRKLRGLFNAYNQALLPLRFKGDGSNWTYSTSAWRVMAGNTANNISICCGLPTYVQLHAVIAVTSSTATKRICGAGIGFNDATIAPNSQYMVGYADNSGVITVPAADFNEAVQLGYNAFYQLEFGGGADVQTWTFNESYGLIGSALL